MKKIMGFSIFILMSMFVWSAGTKETVADTVITNAVVYTVDSQNSLAEAVAIKNGRILAVGSSAELKQYISASTEVIDAEKAMILPAFTDAHMHPAMSAISYLFQIPLQSVFTLPEYLEVIKEFVKQHPELSAYEGAGFMRSTFDAIGPRKEDLDSIESEKPVAIRSSDGHSLWVNSKALEMAKISKLTKDPPGGVIQRIPETGEPSGLLQESAMDLVSHLFPSPSKEQYKEGLLWLQQWFNAKGLTTCHDALVTFDPEYYMAYEELARDGLLTVRYSGSWEISPEMIGGGYGVDPENYNAEMSPEEAIQKGINLSKTFKTPYWRVNSFKFFLDQVIEEETGLLKEPYSHRDDNWHGIQVWDPDFLAEVFRMIDKEGFNIHMHQIGDAAAAYALTALEYAREKNGERDSRHTFAHLQLIDQTEIDRMAALGMTAVIAPYWMVIDDYYWELYEPYLGKHRARNETYPAKSLINSNVNTAVHSDFFVTEPDYGWVFYSAMTRTIPKKIFDLWYGEDAADMLRTTDYNIELNYYEMGPLGDARERMTLDDIIRASTINGAYALFMEEELGSIEPGKLADLIIVDTNLLEADIEEISEFNVIMTFFEGNPVFTAE